ncbi:D-aminoacyl-tRNA deacylase DTD, partial [Trinorchestia longiramus]
MKVFLQRVKECTVKKENQIISKIGPGYALLVGFERKSEDCSKCVNKILDLKLFDRWTNSVRDKDYEIMVLSQFTLMATFKGKKPNFSKACEHERAKELFNELVEVFKKNYEDSKIKNGIFGEYLSIELVNDGPVTMLLD